MTLKLTLLVSAPPGVVTTTGWSRCSERTSLHYLEHRTVMGVGPAFTCGPVENPTCVND
jgi:hypothetical protein